MFRVVNAHGGASSGRPDWHDRAGLRGSRWATGGSLLPGRWLVVACQNGISSSGLPSFDASREDSVVDSLELLSSLAPFPFLLLSRNVRVPL